MKLEICQQIFEKSSNTKFHENSSSGSRVLSCGPTDRQTWAHFFLRCTLKQTKVEPRNSAAVSLSLWPPVLDLLSGADTKFPQSQLKNSTHASNDTFSLLACVTWLQFSSRPGIIRHCFQRNVAKFAKFLVVRRSCGRSAGLPGGEANREQAVTSREEK
jgi:hypothetical protein